MDARAALRIQIEWGADEALDEAPLDRTRSIAYPQPAEAAAAKLPPPVAHGKPGPIGRAQVLADAARTIEDLRAAVGTFTDCPLAVTATNLVFADGNPTAGLVLISDTPGAEEDLSGIPLTGPAGALLDRMLASIGLDRTKLLVTSLVPWRPPGGRAPTESEIAMCLPFLLRHLVLLQPRVVIPLGGLPAKALTNNDAGIRRLRGKPVVTQLAGALHDMVILPMLHPAHLLRIPSAKKDAWADLLALQRLINSP